MNELDPIEGNWYLDLDSGQKFEVVVIDEVSNSIEIQYFDGNIDQIYMEAWNEMNLELIEEPEDWTASLDDVEPDDIQYSEMGLEEGQEEWEEGDFPANGDDDSFQVTKK